MRVLSLLLLAILAVAVTGRAQVAGPIKVSSTGRTFVDQNGKPFFWLGDTGWPLFVQYSQSQAEAYLKRRAEQGFTVIQGVLVWGGGSGMETSTPMPNRQGQKPWLNDNPATPNEAYFKYVDHLVDFANQHGLVLAMLPVWGYYVNDAKIMTTKNARAYGEWLGNRYRNASNVIWVNGGDRVPPGFEAVYRDLAQGLREGDQSNHLISYHGHYSSQFFHEEDWLGFNMIETWTEWTGVYPSVAADGMLSPRKPVVLAEGAYENGPEYPTGPITPLIVRRQTWWTVMAGGAGHTYGQNQMWRMEPGWESTLDTPGALQVALMKKLLISLDWTGFVPDQAVFASGVSSEKTLNTAMRSTKGERVLVYLASQCHVFIHMNKIATQFAKATWINPSNGESKPAGTFMTGNLNEKPFGDDPIEHFSTPGFWEDALLLLEAAETR